MRIIGGELKSRRINFPKTRLTRPMTDRTKETLFNIVGGLVNGKHVLDLFAGSGSLGLESLSRGALDVTFVDQADWAARVIKKNLADLGLASKGEVLETSVFRALGQLEKKGRIYSVVFIDPPFNKGFAKKTLNRLDQSAILAPFAQIVVGHSAHEDITGEFGRLRLMRSKKIGQAYLSFLFRLESGHGETKSYLSGEF